MGPPRFLILGCLVVLAAGGSAGGADGEAKATPCVACHGPGGNSDNPAWPTLAGQHASYLIAQLQAFKMDRRQNPVMGPMAASLSDEDIVEVAAYFATQATRIGVTDAKFVAAGQTLYRGGNSTSGVPACMACHGPNGAGNPAAGYPALRGQHADYAMAQLKAYRSAERTTDARKMMRTIAARLSDEEIEAVAHYVSALH